MPRRENLSCAVGLPDTACLSLAAAICDKAQSKGEGGVVILTFNLERESGHVTFVPCVGVDDLEENPFLTLQPIYPDGQSQMARFGSLRDYEQYVSQIVSGGKMMLLDIGPTDDFADRLFAALLDIIRA